ncbi:restriction endonuclease subunit S [Lactobacillus delbrueckii]|uniref:restriction endonuclease subunit S n=2 Tax=Lactobacillus delbrueckii TaxID=1584 RepID=UPI001143F1C9|nr:restriction endonuclease subunit S [Lactobacillus delbrueckii]
MPGHAGTGGRDVIFAWEQCKLGDVYGHLYSGNTPSRKKSANFGGDTPWIRTADLNNGLIKSATEFLTYEGIKQLKILPENTIVLAMYGGFNQIGRTGILGFPATINQALVALTPHKNINQFFAQSYLNRHIIDWRRVAASSRKDPNITKEDVEKSEFSFGSLEEQNRISKLISRLDHTITLHEEKKRQLERLKSALLQKMFADESGYPVVRFEGFSDEWEERKLGDIAPLRGGFAFKSSKFRNTGVPIVRISNILSSGEVGGDFAYYDEQDKDDKYILPDKSAVLAMSGATTGKVAILSQTDYDKVYQNQRVGYFQPVDYIDYGFISTIVRSELFMMQLESVLVSGAQPNVSSEEIDSFNFMIPILVQEQQKIGQFFKQLDDTIALHQQKINNINSVKKSLLQKMFI